MKKYFISVIFTFVFISVFSQTIPAGKAFVKGQISDYNPKTTAGVKFYVNDYVFGVQNTHFASIDSIGKFRVEFPLYNSQDIYWTYQADSLHRLIVSPNDTLSITIDKQGKVDFAGNNATACYNISDLEHSKETMSVQQMTSALNLEPEEYVKFRKEVKQKETDSFDNLCAQNRCSELFKVWFLRDSEVRYFRDLTDFSWKSLKYGMAGDSKLSTERRAAFNNSFLNAINLNDTLYNRSSSYFMLVNNMSIRQIKFNDPEAMRKFFKAKVRFLLDNKSELSDEEFHLLQGIYSDFNFEREIDSSKADSYWKIVDRFDPQLKIKLSQYSFELLVEKIMETENSNLRDLFLCKYYYQRLESNDEIDYGFEKIRPKISNRKYLLIISNAYNKEKNSNLHLKTMSDLIVSNPQDLESSGDQLLSEILNKNKNKILFIDFWATWCSPCRADFIKMRDVKAELPEDKIAYVYLCCESVKGTWKKIIYDYKLKGQHYFITNRQYFYLQQKFQIHGFPTYIAIDYERKVHRDIPSPSNKQELIRLLKSLIKN